MSKLFETLPRVIYAAIICVGLVSTTLPSAAQTAVDPKSLIGEWQGNYTTRSGSSGRVYLTITEATEKTFKGQQEVVSSSSRVNRREAIEGTVEGSVLRWTSPGVVSGGAIRNEQVVDGNKMNGFSEGSTRSEVVLQKK
jgi:hypothetical protein